MSKSHRRPGRTPSKSPRVPATGQSGELKLMVAARDGAVLSPAQTQFNSLMRRLEKARARHQRERDRLNQLVEVYGRELMPLVDEMHRLTYEMVVLGVAAMKTYKITPRRLKLLTRLFRHKAGQVVEDTCGLTDEQIERMQCVLEELTDPVEEKSSSELDPTEFEFMCAMVESVARQAGVELDLSGLDMHGDQEEFERELQDRLDAAMREAKNNPAPGRTRKPTKAQLTKEKREQEAEEAKLRDLKSLYKQLAKVLHPDLESDPARRLQKEEWMKRLTAAYASADLRDLLSIEMEWLGLESANLAQATDEKLKVYSMVLKEQLELLNFQTRQLPGEPEYALLDRFKHPFFDVILPVEQHKEELLVAIHQHRHMLGFLQAGGAECVKLLNDMADEFARAERRHAVPF